MISDKIETVMRYFVPEGRNLKMQRNAGDLKYLSVFYDMMRKYQESCKESLGDYSFTPNETSMMIYMLGHPEVDTAKEIAVNLGISQSLICRSVDSLTRKGFLTTEKDRKDRRVNHLTLHIPDEELKKTLSRMQGDFLERMTEGVTEEDLAVFQRVVDKMAENVGVRHERLC